MLMERSARTERLLRQSYKSYDRLGVREELIKQITIYFQEIQRVGSILHHRVAKLHAHGRANTLQMAAQLPGIVFVAHREHNGPPVHTDGHVEAQRCNTMVQLLSPQMTVCVNINTNSLFPSCRALHVSILRTNFPASL